MKIGKIIAVVYFLGLLYVTIFSRVFGTYPFTLIAGVNWELFHWFRGSSTDEIVYGTGWWADFFGNLLMFMPFIPCLKQWIKNKKLFFYMLLAFLTSCLIEYTQYKLSIGLAAVDDVMLNTIGAWAGHKVYPYFIRFYNELEK